MFSSPIYNATPAPPVQNAKAEANMLNPRVEESRARLPAVRVPYRRRSRGEVCFNIRQKCSRGVDLDFKGGKWKVLLKF